MKNKEYEDAAVLTVRDAQNLTQQGRKDIANWLRRQARFIEKHGDELAKQFRARYLYQITDVKIERLRDLQKIVVQERTN